MPKSTDVDRHRIACDAFESPGGRDRSQFSNSARKRLAEFDDADQALVHCQVMFDHWVADGVVEPSKLTSVLHRDAANDWPVAEPSVIDAPSDAPIEAQDAVDAPEAAAAAEASVDASASTEPAATAAE